MWVPRRVNGTTVLMMAKTAQRYAVSGQEIPEFQMMGQIDLRPLHIDLHEINVPSVDGNKRVEASSDQRILLILRKQGAIVGAEGMVERHNASKIMHHWHEVWRGEVVPARRHCGLLRQIRVQVPWAGILFPTGMSHDTVGGLELLGNYVLGSPVLCRILLGARDGELADLHACALIMTSTDVKIQLLDRVVIAVREQHLVGQQRTLYRGCGHRQRIGNGCGRNIYGSRYSVWDQAIDEFLRFWQTICVP